MPEPLRPDDDAAAVDAVLDAVAGVPAPIVLVDGPSGAGKSTLADALVAAWSGHAPQLLRMDALVPGWDGLAAGADAVAGLVADHRAGRPARWREWDWSTDRPGPAHGIDPARPLVVEGSGAITSASAALADVAVWVDLHDAAERRRRALERDGDVYAPHWERWARQEAEHAARHAPRSLAGVVLDRAPR